MQIVYFVHATSADNENGLRSGWNDPPLSDTGQSQAHSLQESVRRWHFDAIFASDLNRAAETARQAFPQREVVQDKRLREMNYGNLNGCAEHAFSDDETWCIRNAHEDGESCRDVEGRVRAFLSDCLRDRASGRIAIVSHRFPQLALEVICNGLSWEEALRRDWRRQGQWQAGWEYVFQPG